MPLYEPFSTFDEMAVRVWSGSISRSTIFINEIQSSIGKHSMILVPVHNSLRINDDAVDKDPLYSSLTPISIELCQSISRKSYLFVY